MVSPTTDPHQQLQQPQRQQQQSSPTRQRGALSLKKQLLSSLKHAAQAIQGAATADPPPPSPPPGTDLNQETPSPRVAPVIKDDVPPNRRRGKLSWRKLVKQQFQKDFAMAFA
jgi:hypothetical protein